MRSKHTHTIKLARRSAVEGVVKLGFLFRNAAEKTSLEDSWKLIGHDDEDQSYKVNYSPCVDGGRRCNTCIGFQNPLEARGCVVHVKVRKECSSSVLSR